MPSFNKTYKLPFKFNIPHYTQAYLQKKSLFERYIKFIKRYLYSILKGQKNLEIFNIQSKHKTILWINISAPSLGDSLMDLSSRIMIADKSVDLFTHINNAHIYTNDHLFDHVYTKTTDVEKFKYDLVIIDSYSTRSINIKSKIAPKTSYVGMFGYYNGPEVNRVLFSFHQMNHLLGYVNSENEIKRLAKKSISISRKDQDIVTNLNLPDKYITIALGGEWRYRVYNKWEEVIDRLILDDKELNIVFVGSKNARSISKELCEKFPQNNIINFVEKFSFNQTAEIIGRSQVILCCDGGLMHAANAVDANVIPLFARLTPQMQLTDLTNVFPLYDKKDVNNISVTEILEKYYEATELLGIHPQDE